MTEGNLKKFQKSYFDENYADYELQNPQKKISFYKRLVEDSVRGAALSRPRLLDVGCAFGFLLSSIDSSWDCFGIDASEYAIRMAKKRAERAHVAVSNATRFPFKTPFDVITSFDVLEHIPEIESIPKNIATLLKSGGYFIFVAPVYDGPAGPFIKLLDGDPTHVHKRSRDFWLAWVAPYFSICRWVGIARFIFPLGIYAHVSTN
jgi:2-polyprenyl-3-methyl-5-hydroxy-6-metoxy-1,4-benzoquinol methylase